MECQANTHNTPIRHPKLIAIRCSHIWRNSGDPYPQASLRPKRPQHPVTLSLLHNLHHRNCHNSPDRICHHLHRIIKFTLCKAHHSLRFATHHNRRNSLTTHLPKTSSHVQVQR